MDRRVKERLIGATILVVLVVLVVPELLSGPKRTVVVPQAAPAGPPFRSLTVDLATNKATADGETPTMNPGTAAGATDSAAPEPPHPAPDAATMTPDAATPASTATTPTPDAATTTPDAAILGGPPAAKAGPVHRGWAAQLGSFAARGNAERLERQLRTEGFSPLLSASGSGRALRYRIRVGPFADRAAADKQIARLKAAGHPASVVSP